MFLVLWLAFFHVQAAQAWGLKGHQMQVRVAFHALPADMPAFFLKSEEALVLLGTEPDRWRTPQSPALTEATGPDHSFSWELSPKPLPPDRTQFLAALSASGELNRRPLTMKRFGTAPYAIQEWAEMLTGAFQRWRAMPENTETQRFLKGRHQESILFMAGVLAHWVMDVSQPMHCSIHILGWDASTENPNNYTTSRDIHGRYETEYVEAAIRAEDVASRLKEPAKVLGPWLEATTPYVEACNSHVEQIYRWDREVRFGSGKEPEAAKAFTADRLAEGAHMLRDVWYTCWTKSTR
jgi:hypothetical protein